MEEAKNTQGADLCRATLHFEDWNPCGMEMFAVDAEDASNVVLHDIFRVLGRAARHS